MKTTTICTALLSLVFTLSFTACKDGKSADSNEKMEHMDMQSDDHEPASGEKSHDMMDNHAMHTSAASAVIDHYLQLKNALVADDGAGASKSAGELLTAFKNFDSSSLTPEQQTEVADIIEDATTQAEHIAENARKIDHQREHFAVLSNDVIDLLSLTGTNQKLYLDFCPMANDNKGAAWLSETKEIKNPYLGGKMPACGTVQKEL